jgi:hypothetical protein
VVGADRAGHGGRGGDRRIDRGDPLLFSTVVAFAQRAIAIEDVGAIAALRSGWTLMRTHLGRSLLAGVVNLGLAFVSVHGVLVMLLTAVLLLACLGIALFGVAGLSAPTLVYVAAAGVLLIAGMLTLAGAVNTFFWTF